MLSQQLEEDIRHLGSHKYIAHQLSVIYVRRINQSYQFFKPLLLFCKILLNSYFLMLLYFSQQVISSFRGIQTFTEIKKDIETNFKQMKQCLVVEEGSRHEPQLAAQYINW